MVQYRSFRNNDPPGIVEIWNEAFTSRGVVQLRNSSPLERYAFAKPYFDREGLVVAVDNDVRVGFAHAGFGPNIKQSQISYSSGVICIIGVRPSFRHKGIGSELLERSEAYLRSKGAKILQAGPSFPLNPFYLGLYGGSELPGFLASDEAAAPFLEYNGYRPGETSFVFQKKLDRPVNVPDGRFSGLRKRYEIQIVPQVSVGTWWEECVLGPLEPLEFRLIESTSGRVAGRAEVWEMEGFSWRWGFPTAGIVDVQIREDLRRQGLGKFLIAQILRYLQDQYFGIVEMQTVERNQPAVKLCQSAGFEQLDHGRVYQKDKEPHS